MSDGFDIDFSVKQETIEKIIEWTKSRIEDREEQKEAEKIIRARTDHKLYKFLKEFYCKKFGFEKNVLTIEDQVYPVLAFPAKTNFEIEYPLGSLTTDDDQVFDEEVEKKGGKLLSKMKSRIEKKGKSPIDNYPTYTLENFDQENLKLNCRTGRYEDMIVTCDSLEDEILQSWGENPPVDKSEYKKFWDSLKARKSLHGNVKNPFFEGRLRSNAIAISTPIIFRDEDTWKMMISERSGRVAVHGDLNHVIPSFMMQPLVGYFRDDSYEKEFQIRAHQFEREYLEEVFGYPELKNPEGTPPPYEWYDDKPELKYLRYLIDEEKTAELHFTGIAINLLNLRPEICSVLLIKTEDWIKNHDKKKTININGEQLQLKQLDFDTIEFKDKDEILTSMISKITGTKGKYFMTLGKNLEKPITNNLPPSFCVPPAAPAAYFAVNVAKKVLGIK